ncbi:MAG TPA: DUF177 domain-containing protein [Thermomicrobiaceae bacterium]|nr:DUF177 domain-containing protein [Thermomicrobiaceae bacterium]
MTPQHRKALINDTVVNVAQLLKEPVGATRLVDLRLDQFPLDEEGGARAHDVEAEIRLTRVEGGVLADGQLRGLAELECVRCLELFDAPFAGEFDAEYRPSIDIRTGLPLPRPEDEETFVIDHNHELDLGELLRQVALVALPMQPICREDCPGVVAEVAPEPAGEASDDRLAVLRRLLEDEAR